MRSTQSRKTFYLTVDFTVFYSYWPGKIGASHKCVDENTLIGSCAAWNRGTTVSA